MIRYTEVIDHSAFQHKALLDTFADCIHHEMMTRSQVRLPFKTTRNRFHRYVRRRGLGIHFNSDNNLVEIQYHPVLQVSARELKSDAQRLRQRQHQLRA